MKYIIIAAIILVGCQSAPERENYTTEECYYSADCLYRAGKVNTVCDKLTESCRDALKEKRFYEKLIFCSKTDLGESFDAEKCRLYLNQR